MNTPQQHASKFSTGQLNDVLEIEVDGAFSEQNALWGCLMGLKRAWDLGEKKVILRCDSSDAVQLILEEENSLHEDGSIIHEIKTMLKRSWQKAKSFQTIPAEIRGEEVSRRWITPEKDWVKVNSDGSSRGNPGRAGCGGVIRDHHGAWIVGYCRDVGWSTAFEAECWGAGEGIEVARKLGFQKIHLEIDSEELLYALKGKEIEGGKPPNCVRMMREAVERCKQFRFSLTRRSGNQCADAMAKLSLEKDLGRECQLFFEIPQEVVRVARDEEAQMIWRDTG
ncbi:uncharacterized protein LOC114729445 [Neltuma alba]|uniref:uncharacterized protein LOC114729445 n=1 Tax=Neltuma alba TaxID=207710 RepID=UPI0010A501A7|nr:uncharacterized protein LOC114729445 [Prosopis alba]